MPDLPSVCMTMACTTFSRLRVRCCSSAIRTRWRPSASVRLVTSTKVTTTPSTLRLPLRWYQARKIMGRSVRMVDAPLTGAPSVRTSVMSRSKSSMAIRLDRSVIGRPRSLGRRLNTRVAAGV